MKKVRNIALLMTPVLLFFVLVVPYQILNEEVLVDIFGCGCPKLDENGEMIHSYFNANDFTTIFWSVIAAAATVGSVFLSRLIPREKIWLRIVYIAATLAISLFIAYTFRQGMMWN